MTTDRQPSDWTAEEFVAVFGEPDSTTTAGHKCAGLHAVLERLRVAAEQYLDTEHRDEARDLELRRNLGEAATDAALVPRQGHTPACVAGVVCEPYCEAQP